MPARIVLVFHSMRFLPASRHWSERSIADHPANADPTNRASPGAATDGSQGWSERSERNPWSAMRKNAEPWKGDRCGFAPSVAPPGLLHLVGSAFQGFRGGPFGPCSTPGYRTVGRRSAANTDPHASADFRES